jgi:hypothetical protein
LPTSGAVSITVPAAELREGADLAVLPMTTPRRITLNGWITVSCPIVTSSSMKVVEGSTTETPLSMWYSRIFQRMKLVAATRSRRELIP